MVSHRLPLHSKKTLPGLKDLIGKGIKSHPVFNREIAVIFALNQ